jgi:hypothetical protein
MCAFDPKRALSGAGGSNRSAICLAGRLVARLVWQVLQAALTAGFHGA